MLVLKTRARVKLALAEFQHPSAISVLEGMEPQLSVLICSILDRVDMASALLHKLNTQAAGQPVEILCYADNRAKLLPVKRNMLLAQASGRFVAHLDDDDDIAPDYVSAIVSAALTRPDADVISFDQISKLEGQQSYETPFRVRTGLHHQNQDAYVANNRRADIMRKPWHWCAWSARLAKAAVFEVAVDEDWRWIQQMLPEARVEQHIDKVLHYYRWSPSITTFAGSI